jgi:hypothetical protein
MRQKPENLDGVAYESSFDVFISNYEASFYDYIKHSMKQLLCKSSVRLSADGIFSRKGQ